MNNNIQFKTLVQYELDRLETIIAHGESIYPVTHHPYARTTRTSKLLSRQPSRYRYLLSFVHKLGMTSF